MAHYFALPAGDRMRFYCLVLDDAEGRVLKDAEGLGVGSKVHVLLGVGSFDATVTKVGD